MSEETTAEMLAEIDRDMAEIEKAVSALQKQAAKTNYPQQVETTTDTLAEIEGQAAEYTPPEGWRVLQVGEVLQEEDWIIDARDGNGSPTRKAGSKVGEHQVGQHQIYIRQIESEPEKIITPDDVAAESLAGVWDHAQAERQIAELRSEVSYVQNLLGDSSRRVAELETLVADLRTVNAAQEKAVKSADRDKADLQHRLDVVSAECAQQAGTINSLQTQLEAVKAELVQVSRDRHALQVELDAREQVPTSTDDRFEQGWDKGTARAVETIAEWTEPFRTCGSQGLSYHVMQNLPHIMRNLNGLTDED